MRCRTALLFSIALLSSAPLLFAEEYPFAGVVSGEDVNVRSGANLNYEIIGKLDNNETVVVLAKAYDWYKVKLRDNALVFVNKPFLRRINDSEAEVIANDVNVRARPNTNSTILGKLAKGNRVNIVREVPDWYQVAPPPSLSGYVFAAYIHYKSSYADYIKEEKRRAGFEKRLVELRSLVDAEFEKDKAVMSFANAINAIQKLRQDYPEHASRRGLLQEMDRLRIKQLELENERVKAELEQAKVSPR